jgi:hypothetical protein
MELQRPYVRENNGTRNGGPNTKCLFCTNVLYLSNGFNCCSELAINSVAPATIDFVLWQCGQSQSYIRKHVKCNCWNNTLRAMSLHRFFSSFSKLSENQISHYATTKGSRVQNFRRLPRVVIIKPWSVAAHRVICSTV